MSYGASAALQAAVFARLAGDAAVSAGVGDAIYDAPPAGALPVTFVMIGAEEVRARGDATGAGAEHRFTVSVLSRAGGYQEAKTVAGAVCDALDGAELSLVRGRLVGLWFDRARAARTGRAGDIRRIDLRFRARIEDD
jgi:hypothetical protein